MNNWNYTQEQLEYVAEDIKDLIINRFCEKLELNKSDDYIVTEFISDMLFNLEFDNLIKLKLITENELENWLANAPELTDEE